MIEFKSSLRVRCLECKEEDFIDMKHIGTEKEERSLGVEYEHIFRGEHSCSHCGEDMKLLTTIYEFPKGYFNYHDTNNESCLIMEDITVDSFNIL